MTGPLIDSPLVSTQWLADHLGSEQLVVLDATVLTATLPSGRTGFVSGHESYVINGHLPGAVFADVIEDLSDPEGTYPFTRPAADAFAIAVGALGIDNDTTVVVYDGALGQWAARVWWLFRAAGYDRVAVLDGGLKKWTTEARELEHGHVEPAPTVFTVVERPELWVTKADVAAIVNGDAAGGLVCGIPPKEFTGEQPSRARAGHIPGSLSVPAARLVDRDTNALVGTEQLRATFAPVLEDDRVITYCNGGIVAAADALVLTLLGHRNVALYDGSLNEWTADDSAPLTVVEAAAV